MLKKALLYSFAIFLVFSWGYFPAYPTDNDPICPFDSTNTNHSRKKKKSKKQQLHEYAIRLDATEGNKKPIKENERKYPFSNYVKDVYNQLDTSKYSWADSVFNSLTPDERLAQLFMIPAYSNKGKEHKEQIASLVYDYKVGGIIFFQGGPVRQAALTNYYQSLSKVPLMISIDAEWGLSMRLDSTFKFPRQMMMGAIRNDSLVYRMGAEIARHCKRIGTHINFAPDIDINNNPANPVISNRSFGEDKNSVTQKGIMYMKGMQDEKVLTTGKHFPGHGDTDSDSHLTLPIIKHSRERIDSLELYPFRHLFRQGLLGAMVAHLYIPNLDSTPNLASTLSPKIVNDLLKEELNYKGLIFTDALNMKGVAKFYEPGIVDLKAVLAGNDVLLNAEDVPKAMEQIQEAIYQGILSWDQINSRCLKILRFKEWLGLNNYKPVDLKNIYEDINTPESELVNRLIVEEAITVLSNKNEILPLKYSDTLKIASLAINEEKVNDFQSSLGVYAKVDHFNLPKNAKLREIDSLKAQLINYDLIIAGVFNIQTRPEGNFGMPSYTAALIDTLSSAKPLVLSMFGNAYSISKLKSVKKFAALIESYEDNAQTQSVAAQIIFGALGSKGRLPVSVPPFFKLNDGVNTNVQNVIRFKLPVQLNINDTTIKRVEQIISSGIKEKAYPGCQVLAAKDGSIFYNKSFGKYSYEDTKKIDNNSIYDLASVTKIAASSLAIMKLYEDGYFNLDDTLGAHLPELRGTNKSGLIIREVLSHQSGLPSWIPFFNFTIKNDSVRSLYYSEVPNDTFSIRVAEGMYLRNDYIDTLYKKIYDCDLGPKKYNYSDLGYYIMKKIVERYTHKTLDSFVTNTFYKPMGLWSMRYNPRTYFNLDQIVQTEDDKIFRKQVLKGDVHDQGAAMLGGVGGHAGLFGSAQHLAVLMQMLLNGGTYNNIMYLKKETISLFTSCQFCEAGNRRALCFEKQEPDKLKDSPTAPSASLIGFGHSGFTGTYAWADPETGLVFVFLSNRVNPDSENKKIIKMGIRTKIHDVFNIGLKYGK